MAKIENFLTSRTSSIIHDALGHYTDHRAFTRVYIANDGDSYIILVSTILSLGKDGILELVRVLHVSYFSSLILVKYTNISW